jgi:hypothetical protein
MSEVTIQIDAKTKATRVDDERWVVQKRNREGAYATAADWTGPRRSLLRWLEDNKVYPSREAERQLAEIPERKSFKEDSK